MPPRSPYNKPPLSYKDQISQLKQRGLKITDDKKAEHLLHHISYYRLSGYWYPLLAKPKSAHRFKKGATFKTAFTLYCFDRELRKLVLGELEKIEVAIRAEMIYVLSHKTNNPFWYTEQQYFINNRQHADTLNKIRHEVNRSDADFIQAFKTNYNNADLPSWMALEVSSFGTLSKLYSNLKNKGSIGYSKRSIANHFGLNTTVFQSWLHSFTYIRNSCAHHSRLWNRKLQVNMQIPTNPTNSFISNSHTTPKSPTISPALINTTTYFVIVSIVYMLNVINPNHSFPIRLEALFSKYPNIDRSAIGYTNQWTKEELWKPYRLKIWAIKPFIWIYWQLRKLV